MMAGWVVGQRVGTSEYMYHGLGGSLKRILMPNIIVLGGGWCDQGVEVRSEVKEGGYGPGKLRRTGQMSIVTQRQRNVSFGL